MIDVNTTLGNNSTIEVGIELEPLMPYRDPLTGESIEPVKSEIKEVFYITLKNRQCGMPNQWKMCMTREQAEEIGAGLMQMLSLHR